MTDESAPDSSGDSTPPTTPSAHRKPSESSDLLGSLDVVPTSLVRAMVVGAMAYGFAWISGLVCTALVILLLHVEDAGSEVSWWWLLSAPAQLVAMAFRSPAVMSISSADEEFAFGGSVSTTAPALTILALALIAVFRLSRRDEAAWPSKSTTSAVTLSIATAFTFVMMGWLLALVLKLSIEDSDGETTFGAGQFQLFLFGLIAVSVAALFGRRPWNTWDAFAAIPHAARDAWRAVLTHVAVFSALTIPAAIVWISVQGGATALLALPAALGNGLVYALTIGHLGALTAGGAGSFLGETSSDSDSVWAFTDGADKILLLLILFAFMSAMGAAAVLHERRRGAPRTNSQWVWAALVYGAVGGTLTWLATVSSGLGSSVGAAGSVSFGPAPWFFLVFALWGLLAELGARLIGPSLVSVLPTAWVNRAAGEPGALSEPKQALASSLESGSSTAAEAERMDPKTKKLLVVGAGLITAVIVAVVGVSLANKMFFGPEQQAVAYFSALADGDAKTALGLARFDYSSDERVLLTNEILRGSGTKITDVEVGDVETTGEFAEVSVEYTLDGAEHSQDVSLKKSGSKFGLFNDWELVDPGLGVLYVSAPSASGLVVNGETVSISDLEDGVTLMVFPGTYEVSPSAGSKYLTFEKQTISIAEDEENLEFEVSASGELATEVSRQADEFLAACIAKTEAEPDGCPNTTYEGFELKNVTWTLDVSPQYSVTSDSYDGVTFETSTPGKATIKATEPGFFDGDPATKFTDTVDINLSGAVSIEGDTVTIDVEDYFF